MLALNIQAAGNFIDLTFLFSKPCRPTEMELDLEGEDGEKLGQVLATFTVSPKNIEDRQEVNSHRLH